MTARPATCAPAEPASGSSSASGSAGCPALSLGASSRDPPVARPAWGTRARSRPRNPAAPASAPVEAPDATGPAGLSTPGLAAGALAPSAAGTSSNDISMSSPPFPIKGEAQQRLFIGHRAFPQRLLPLFPAPGARGQQVQGAFPAVSLQ